jgi:hypothetical protein
VTAGHPFRLALACALVATLTGGAAAVAAGANPSAPATTTASAPLADDTDVNAMLDLEAKIDDSLQQGHTVPVHFPSPDQVPGTADATGAWGDSGLWTGVYLGGESMRYATAQHYLHLGDHGNSAGHGSSDSAPGHQPLTDEQVAFWTAQRDQAFARIRTILAAEHRDINIAEDWTGSLKIPPDVNTNNPTNPTNNIHEANFGGGVIQGERGMIMRACTPKGLGPMGVNPPTVDPDHPVNNNSNRVYEITWKHGDGRTYYCETSPSRDTYAGLTFGLLTAFDLVGPDDHQLRDQIRDDLLAMGNFLVKYGWCYPRPTGYVSAHHDFDGFISPLFVYVPMARLNMANAARHVADVAGSAADKQKWDAIWAEELSNQGPELGPSMEVDAAQPNDGYYKFNLHHLTAFNLLRTTTGTERDLIARGFAVVDKTTRDDVNAHFEAITYSATGDKWRLDAAVEHLRQWLQYRANTSGGAYVTNSLRCGVDFTCVPQDQYEIAVDQAPGGSVTWFPGQPDLPPVSSSQGIRAARPLPVAVRPPTDFLWQRPPTALDGHEDAQWREPGIDFLTPYWMIRYYTEVAHPTGTSFPEWVGPAHL